MKILILFFIIIKFESSIYSQNKDSIDICLIPVLKPSVIAFNIPTNNSIQFDTNTYFLKNEINKNFVIEANLFFSNSFIINEYNFFEAYFNNNKCDSIAILFIFFKNKIVSYTKPYKLTVLTSDFRFFKNKEQIILYRKVKNINNEVTMSFEFYTNKNIIFSFRDDGLSLW